MKFFFLRLAAARAISALISFFGVALIARTHTLEVVGEINASIAVMQVAALGLGFGLSTAIVYYAKGDSSAARQLTTHAFLVTVGLTIPATALASLLSPTYALLAACSGLLAILAHVAGFLQSNQQFDKQALLMVVQSCTVPAANQLALLLSDSVFWFLAAYVSANFVLAAVFVSLMVKPYLWSALPSGYPGRSFYRYGATALGHNGVNAAWYSADVLLVRYGLGADFLGIYSLATSVAKSSWIAVDSVGLIIFPRRIAGTLSDRQYRRVQILCVVYGLVAVATWVCLGEIFLNIIFGPQYSGAFPVVLALLVGSLAVGAYKLQSRLIAAAGEWRELNLAQILGLSVSVGAAAVLGAGNDAIGVAFGQSLGFCVCVTVLYFLGRSQRKGSRDT